MNHKTVYESLKGTKIKHSRLTIRDFEPADYEELWNYLLEEVIGPILDGEDYYAWLQKKALAYLRFRCANRYYGEEVYDPLTACRPEDLDTRQQLAIIKFYLYRTSYSMCMQCV